MQHLSILMSLQRARRAISELARPRLEALGFTPTIFLLLKVLESHPYPTEVSRRLGVPAATVSRMLRDLERRGYLERATSADDLRRYRFSLTTTGRAVLAEGTAAIEGALTQLLRRLTPGDQRELDRLLGLLAYAGQAVPAGGAEETATDAEASDGTDSGHRP